MTPPDHSSPDDAAPETKAGLETLKMFAPYVTEHKARIVISITLLILAKVATVITPLVLKEIIDDLNPQTSDLLVLPLVLLLIYGGLRFSSTLFRESRNIIFARVRFAIMRQISTKVVAHLHELSLRYHLDRKTGALSRDINRGTNSVSTVLSHVLFNILPTILEVLMVCGILMSQYSAWFAIVAAITFSAYVALTLKMTTWRIPLRKEMNKTESEANTRAIDALLNYETVKYFGNEAYEVDRYTNSLKQWEDAGAKSYAAMGLLNLGQGLIIALGVTSLMVLAAQGVAAGEMTLGDLVAVNAFLIQLFIPLGFLGMIYNSLKNAFADMERMLNLFRETSEVEDIPDAPALRTQGGHVRFEGVGFSYGPDRQILHDVNLDIPAGSKVALVGASGSGKSTLAKLLFRFYDPSHGRITIDGQDIKMVSQDSLRSKLGVVPQDTVLFNDTIAYNINYARLSATREEVEHATKLASLEEFVQRLPQGYDTVVGERGLKLSGGEKQRVAIARAILKQPPVMIFDEATSSLDSNSERAILDALNQVAQAHTTLVIAHRLSTIVDADLIVVLDQGHVLEQGTHEDLIQAQGAYAQMWALQQDSTPGDVLPTPSAG